MSRGPILTGIVAVVLVGSIYGILSRPVPLPDTPVIPGLEAREVISLLRREGLHCDREEKTRAGIYMFTCKRSSPEYEYVVFIFSPNGTHVDYIDATVSQFQSASDDRAVELLRPLAYLPYDDAEPSQIAAWLEWGMPGLPVLGTWKSHRFGGVRYRMSGPLTARSLELEPEVQQ